MGPSCERRPLPQPEYETTECRLVPEQSAFAIVAETSSVDALAGAARLLSVAHVT
jgi:hypothetical protein